MTLADLIDGQHGRVIVMGGKADLEAKLREIGFCEGDVVQVITRGPLGGQPLAVRLNRRVIAMRLEEAAALTVDAHDG
jgi:ferrous iron transport protein A